MLAVMMYVVLMVNTYIITGTFINYRTQPNKLGHGNMSRNLFYKRPPTFVSLDNIETDMHEVCDNTTFMKLPHCVTALNLSYQHLQLLLSPILLRFY